MKKKSERFSFKKLNQVHKRQDSKLTNELILTDKSKQSKTKSSDKINEAVQKFKISTKMTQ